MPNRILLAVAVLALIPVLDASAQQGARDGRSSSSKPQMQTSPDDLECANNLLRYDKERAASNTAVEKLVGQAIQQKDIFEQDLYYSQKALKILRSKVCQTHSADVGRAEFEKRDAHVAEVQKSCAAIASDCKAAKHW